VEEEAEGCIEGSSLRIRSFLMEKIHDILLITHLTLLLDDD